MIPKFLDRNLFLIPALLGVVGALGFMVYNDPDVAALRGVKRQAADYCAMANLRTCKVTQQGEWIMVTTPDGASHMLFMQNGKVLQVQ